MFVLLYFKKKVSDLFFLFIVLFRLSIFIEVLVFDLCVWHILDMGMRFDLPRILQMHVKTYQTHTTTWHLHQISSKQSWYGMAWQELYVVPFISHCSLISVHIFRCRKTKAQMGEKLNGQSWSLVYTSVVEINLFFYLLW